MPPLCSEPFFEADTRGVVWVSGALGLIGNYVIQTAAQFAPAWRAVGLTRQRFDLLDFRAVRTAFATESPRGVIHCAGMTKTGACEADPAAARRINVETTAFLADLASEIPFLFLSTDLVFDGREGRYRETDAVNPLTVYGETKVEAERLVLANPQHTVVRTSLNYGRSPSGNRAFNEEMVLACRGGKRLKLFSDEFRCPIAAAVLAEVLWLMLGRGQPGLYHVAGAERLSRWEIGQLLASRCPELRGCLEVSSLRDFEGPPRSPDTSLDCGKFEKVYGFALPRFSQWLTQETPSQSHVEA